MKRTLSTRLTIRLGGRTFLVMGCTIHPGMKVQCNWSDQGLRVSTLAGAPLIAIEFHA